MNNGWRSRFVAPVYAAVISFLFVVILGWAVLDDPMRIKFMIPGPPNGAKQQATKLKVPRVILKTADGSRTLAEEQLGLSGEFTVLNPKMSILICTRLPEGWVSVDPVDPEASMTPEESCWQREGEEVEITLNDPIRIRFTILNGSKQHAQELHDFSVLILKAADGGQLDERKLDSPREFTVLNPHENFQICTALPAGWFVVKEKERKTREERCPEREAAGGDVEILLSRQED